MDVTLVSILLRTYPMTTCILYICGKGFARTSCKPQAKDQPERGFMGIRPRRGGERQAFSRLLAELGRES